MSQPEHAGRLATPVRVPDRWLLFGVWCASAVLGFVYLDRGWMPHDVGTLGHAAERVLAGELPHRDFVDVYTGGQAMLNALAFSLFGVHVMTLRYVFFAAYLLWVPTVWVVARSVTGPTLAAAATLLAASLTLPVYPEGMPSWYNLFFATAGAACLITHVKQRGAKWLVLAGLAGGASILFKVVGLYYVAAALLFLVYLESLDDEEGLGGGAARDGEQRAKDTAYRALAFSACAVMGLLALYVVNTGSDAAGLIHFAVPPLAAVTAVALRFRTPGARTSAERTRALTVMVAPFVAGVAIPLAAFLVPYAASGSLGVLYEGVFVLPRLRFEFAAWDSPPLLGFIPAVALVAWIARSPSGSGVPARVVLLCGAALVTGLVATTHVDIVYRIVWWTLRSLGPVVAFAGAWALVRSGDGRASRPVRSASSRAGMLLALAVFGFCNLVQIPFAAPIYFLYAAPLLVLAGAALLPRPAASSASASWLPGATGRLTFVTVLLLGFSIFRLDAGFLYHLGFRYRPHRQTEVLTIERARGLRVTPEEKAETEQLVRAIDELGPGSAILALPDAPEVYFLTHRDNPTPTLFEFFGDPDARLEQTLSVIDRDAVQVVVLNRRQLFSPPVQGPLLDSLRARFRWSAEVGRFQVLWVGPPNGEEAGGGGSPAR